jgi:hypothetical protein
MSVVALRWFCRFLSALLLYGMTLQLWRDLRVVTDPTVSFGGSLKDGSSPAQAVVNAVVLPLVVFLVYFANWGRARQTRLATVALCITGLAPLAYFVVSLRSRLAGGYIDMELVAGAMATTFLWFGVALGVLLRWRLIQVSERGTHPRCKRCGYDLTGSVTGRCSECGTPIASVYP